MAVVHAQQEKHFPSEVLNTINSLVLLDAVTAEQLSQQLFKKFHVPPKRAAAIEHALAEELDKLAKKDPQSSAYLKSSGLKYAILLFAAEESGLIPNALNQHNCVGLFQICPSAGTPTTKQELDIKVLSTVKGNIKQWFKMLEVLEKRLGEQWYLAPFSNVIYLMHYGQKPREDQLDRYVSKKDSPASKIFRIHRKLELTEHLCFSVPIKQE